MNKKVLILVITLVAVMMFSSLVPVLATPKNQVTFKLFIQGAVPSAASLHTNGYLFASPDKLFAVPPVVGVSPTWHYRDAPFNPTNVWLEIDGETIPYTRLSYTAFVSGEINWVESKQIFRVDEVVTIYTTEAKTTVLGTIDIHTRSIDVLPSTYDVAIGTFVGHGTGDLEGVKVQGASLNENLPGSTRVRDGVATGWLW